MAAKVQRVGDAWYVVTHFKGRRRKTSFGKGKAAKREAERNAKQVNESLSGNQPAMPARRELACDVQLRAWIEDYAITLKATTRKTNQGLIENHLIPYFGSRPLDEITERDLLRFIEDRIESGLGTKTIQNALGVLRHVYNLLESESALVRNPAKNIGTLIRKVANAQARETKQVESWTRQEVETLLAVAWEHEPNFAPFLATLFSTGMRRGEAMGLQWADVNFEDGFLTLRRSVGTEGESTPKNGRARRVQMTPSLASELFDVLATRREQGMARGWPETPKWVFCSEVGTALDPGNVRRVWDRVRRRAQPLGVRPLRIHDARHTWATLALHANKNIRWVSEQLGHADPAFTLRTYAHVLRGDEIDLSFADFSSSGRPNTAQLGNLEIEKSPNYAESMVRREGFEPPTLRFEA